MKNPRLIPVAATGCLLLAGAVIYRLELNHQEIPISGLPVERSHPSHKAPALPLPGSAEDAPASTTAGATDSAALENKDNPPFRNVARVPGVNSTVQPEPEVRTGRKEKSRMAGELTDDKPFEQTAQTVPAAQAPVGLRLAPDVRLPVAAMPHDLKLSSVAQEALEQIVIDYYQDLAKGLKERPSVETATQVPAPQEEPGTGELTQIITNGPATDAARERADQRFKALFGHAAYNRMTIRTLLEARLPATASE